MAKKLQVVAKKNGFRRAGFAFSDTTPTHLDPGKLEDHQIEALRNEPQLVVTEIDVPDAPKDNKDKGKGASTEK